MKTLLDAIEEAEKKALTKTADDLEVMRVKVNTKRLAKHKRSAAPTYKRDPDMQAGMRSLADRLMTDKNLAPEEHAVLGCIIDAYDHGVRITQRNIVKAEPWRGCHPTHEADIVRDELETTMRQVRDVVRRLRVNHAVPIVDYSDGYTLPGSMAEVQDYLKRKEGTAKSLAKSFMITYNALKRSLGIRSNLFDAMDAVDDLPTGPDPS